MLYNYFTKLGNLNYNGTVVSNIITSVRFKEVMDRTKATFYPYVIKEGQRPDQIAYDYYDDSRYAWLVLLANRITDPYYQWPLSVNEFTSYIIKKYGSVERAMGKAAYYRNNFKDDDTILDAAGYNALPANHRKYYKEINGYNGVVIGYDRRKDEVTIESNKTIELTVNSTTGFIIGERITQKTSGALSATATLKAINGNVLVCSQVNGAFLITAGAVGSVIGSDSQATKSCTVASVVIDTAIPDDEASFYTEVSSYTYEDELNDMRKTINLIDRDYVLQIEDQIRELMT